MQSSWIDTNLSQRLARLSAHLVVALVALVGIGGATRVMEAGLACPDWPLCYGSLLPGGRMNMQVFLEWFHRLDAFVVGVALLVLWLVSLWQRRTLPHWLPWLSSGALLLVLTQGGLGALTVLALLPTAVVTAHLGMALLLVALISAASQRLLITDAGTDLCPDAPIYASRIWAVLAATGLCAVIAQCLLGGAMATRWAAAQCVNSGSGCAWLSAHRQLAVVVALAVIAQACCALLLRRPAMVSGLSLAAAGLVLLQIVLGLVSWQQQLHAPLITVTHQVVAALLVAVLAAGLSREVAHG